MLLLQRVLSCSDLPFCSISIWESSRKNTLLFYQKIISLFFTEKFYNFSRKMKKRSLTPPFYIAQTPLDYLLFFLVALPFGMTKSPVYQKCSRFCISSWNNSHRKITSAANAAPQQTTQTSAGRMN